jgi:hypothetical protein
MVRLYSRLLQETIFCTEDDHVPEASGDRILYTRSEVLALQGLDPEAIRAVHEVKKHFGGRYLGSNGKS